MKALLVGVNAKYIHTSLSVRTLCAYVNTPDLSWTEFNINEDISAVCADIYHQKADMVLFSCYIWNIEFILKLGRRLKSVAPGTLIILGGPEVSYSASEYMENNPFIDGIITGEGEEALKRIMSTGTLKHDGVVYRRNGNGIVISDSLGLITDISEIPFPYTEADIEQNKNKLIYYESSRGCPFNCSYCLSSTNHSVRYRSLELVFNELKFFIEHGVKIVKFTDRTFNANKQRTKQILEFLIQNVGITTFHFEIAADILDDEIMSILESAPKGLFQLEIGVQSTNPKTLAAIDRKTDTSKIASVVQKIRSFGNIHTHLDLIAGLPFEDYTSFKNSFNDVFSMKPHVIQLGFLKLLHGTKIRETEVNDVFTAEPPYEVLQTEYISYDELLCLKSIEDIVEKYYNSGVFPKSAEYLVNLFDTPFDFFEKLADFYQRKGYDRIGISRDKLYEIMLDFAGTLNATDISEFIDLLLFDYLKNNKSRTPEWAKREPIIKERFEILTEEFICKNLPEYINTNPKEIIKHVHFERFFNPERILIFDNKYDRIITLNHL